jgi:hypothetical protein
MTQCERLSDRIPEVVLGRSLWSVEERAHFDACPDCQAEWELVQSTARLGASLAPRSSPEVMAAAVLDRLAGERAATGARRRRWLALGLAAAAVTIIAVRIPRPTSVAPMTGSPAAVTGRQVVPLPELDDLPDSELESILQSLDESSAISPSLDGSGFDDLDDHELERVLGTWEG